MTPKGGLRDRKWRRKKQLARANLTMALINIRGSLTNFHEIINLLDAENSYGVGEIDVLAITETKDFRGRIGTPINGFQQFTALDSMSAPGVHAKGGVALYVRESLKGGREKISLPQNLALDNIVWVKLGTARGPGLSNRVHLQ
jgi:hypothetical protein